tara:strand:+ start:604 stop:795 length:192 start_codon:yes stop_codon:yes gene_type:complete
MEQTYVFRCLKEGFVSTEAESVEEAREHLLKYLGHQYIDVPGSLGSGTETGDSWVLEDHVDTF